MKLSKKGYEKLFEFFMSGKYFDATKCDQIEFEPDDFEDRVVLTVEEAKRVQSALYELLRNSNDKNSSEWLTYWFVNGRIEQACNQKESQ